MSSRASPARVPDEGFILDFHVRQRERRPSWRITTSWGDLWRHLRVNPAGAAGPQAAQVDEVVHDGGGPRHAGHFLVADDLLDFLDSHSKKKLIDNKGRKLFLLPAISARLGSGGPVLRI